MAVRDLCIKACVRACACACVCVRAHVCVCEYEAPGEEASKPAWAILEVLPEDREFELRLDGWEGFGLVDKWPEGLPGRRKVMSKGTEL